MAEIRVEHITLRYHTAALPVTPSAGLIRRGYSGYRDRAFVERLASRPDALPETSGPITALDDVSLTIRDGETLAIIGPSGCGKSTLLKVIAGLEHPSDGRVLYDGSDVDSVRPGERRIGMVFQSYALYPHMEGEGNLGFFFRMHRRPPEETMERIRVTSEIMGLGFDELLPRRPSTLSGGQQQRVAIGRCIVRDPSLFLFDEPLSNLDAELRARTRVEIKRLLRRFAITAVYVTHDQLEATALGDRLAVMRDGRIEQVGTYQEIREQPGNAFVAGFVGRPPINMVEGYVLGESGLAGPVGTVSLSAEFTLPQADSYTLGFRPSAATPLGSESPAADLGMTLCGTVRTSEPDFGRHEQTVYIEAGDHLIGLLLPLEARVTQGETLRAHVPMSGLYLFDGANGQRLYPR